MKKGITINKFEVAVIEMAAPEKKTTINELSVYSKPEQVIKSLQSGMMKEGKVVVGAKIVESKKCEIDLDAVYASGTVVGKADKSV